MEFRILGPLEVYEPGRAVPLGGAKQRALLAVLLLDANHVVSVDRLVDELWGDQQPATAAHTIQVYVSQLRKLLAADRLVTRAPGYLLTVGPDELDLHRFERLLDEGRRALTGGDAERAAECLREGLALWRGDALADFSFEPFAQAAISRLEELRLAAVEDRIDADLALGRHADMVGELDALIRRNPLRERPRGQLMLALYRAGRQAEALQAYQDARRVLVEELGIDPSPSLQELEKAILNQDPALAWQPADEPARRRGGPVTGERSILVLSDDEDELSTLLQIAEPLARSQVPHELILARLIGGDGAGSLGVVTAELQSRRTSLLDRGVPARAAAFVTREPGGDIVRLASQQEVDLLLVEAGGAVTSNAIEGALRTTLEEAPCDVGILAGRGMDDASDGPVLVPFGAGEHDWGALELGAWIASAYDVPLRLLGAEADDDAGRPDASRLLATAALAVQQLAGVMTEPLLAPTGAESVLEAAEGARLLVVGLSERWRGEGAGPVRAAIAERSSAPVVLVRRGVRPGGLTPPESLTRYTWSLSSRSA